MVNEHQNTQDQWMMTFGDLLTLLICFCVFLLVHVDAQAAELVKLRHFGGFGFEDAAKLLDIPVRTAYRDWAYAPAWLFKKIELRDSRPAK